MIQTDDIVRYQIEFFNTLNFFRFPSHKLIPKIGASVILLKHLNPPNLCNETRLRVKTMQIL